MLDLATQFAGPFATIVASATAGLIAAWLGKSQIAAAKLQATTAHNKTVLDLFDKRLEIYSGVRKAIGKVVTSGHSTSEDQFEFLVAVDRAKFLFGPEVTEYFDQLYIHLLDLELANSELKDQLSTEARREAVTVRRKHFNAISDFYKEAPDLLAPYLSAHQKFSA